MADPTIPAVTQTAHLFKDDNELPTPIGNYVHITADAPTTTVIKASAGFLYSIIINTPVASSVISIYDNPSTSGTAIGIITLPASILTNGPISALYNLNFTTGLTIITATGASDITVVYR